MAPSRPERRWLWFGIAAAALFCSALVALGVTSKPGAPLVGAPDDGKSVETTESSRRRLTSPLPSTPLPAGRERRGAVPDPAPRRRVAARPEERGPVPLGTKALLEKAGEKDGDTTYTRLVEQALDVVPGLTDDERGTLRAIAYKRQARLKATPDQLPANGGTPALLEGDHLTTFERDLLGPERYREYQAALTDLLHD